MGCCTTEWIGLFTIIWFVAYTARLIYRTFIYKCDLNQFQTKSNDAYALVTGSTSGIGEAFAHELARRGFNLILVSRSDSKLAAVAKDIQAKYPKVRTTNVVSDATKRGKEDGIDAVVAAASKVNLSILINNVGISTEDPEPLEQNKPEEIEDLITVNCRYSSLLTQRIIPLLKKHSKSGKGNRGAIVNVSSLSAYIHVPLLAVYSATKAFNLAFSNAIREELAPDNIEVLSLTPGFVMSNMTKIRESSLNVPTAEACATSALDAIGWRSTCGYWFHEINSKVSLLVPASLRGPLALKAITQMREAKKASLAKKAAEALTKSD